MTDFKKAIAERKAYHESSYEYQRKYNHTSYMEMRMKAKEDFFKAFEKQTEQEEIEYGPVDPEKVNYYIAWKDSKQRRVRDWVSNRISYGGRFDVYKRKILCKIVRLLAPKYGLNDLTPNEKIAVGSVFFAKAILKQPGAGACQDLPRSGRIL